MKLMRHVGRLKAQPLSRLVVVYKQLPDDPFYALVIFPDRLVKNVDRDELVGLANSDMGQKEEVFANALYRKGNMLAHFHEMGSLKKIHIDEVEMTPTNTMAIPLREVINQVNRSRGLPELPASASQNAISSADPRAADLKESIEQSEQKEAIAKSLLMQAAMLEGDVIKKRNEAYALAPHLRPVDAVIPDPVIVEEVKHTSALITRAQALGDEPVVETSDNVVEENSDVLTLKKSQMIKEPKKKRRKKRRKQPSKAKIAAITASI